MIFEENKEEKEYEILRDVNNRLKDFNKDNKKEKDDDDGR